MSHQVCVNHGIGNIHPQVCVWGACVRTHVCVCVDVCVRLSVCVFVCVWMCLRLRLYLMSELAQGGACWPACDLCVPLLARMPCSPLRPLCGVHPGRLPWFWCGHGCGVRPHLHLVGWPEQQHAGPVPHGCRRPQQPTQVGVYPSSPLRWV